jgi:hypothetical protein
MKYCGILIAVGFALAFRGATRGTFDIETAIASGVFIACGIVAAIYVSKNQ